MKELIEHLMLEPSPTLRAVPQNLLHVVVSDRLTPDQAKNVKMEPAPTLNDALGIMNQCISFKVAETDGALETKELTILKKQHLEMDPDAPTLEETGAIQEVPVLKDQFLRKRAMAFMLEALSGEKQTRALTNLLSDPTARANYIIHLRSAAAALRNLPTISTDV